MPTYLGLITPINIAVEKEKFFASDDYSPQFRYAWEPEALKELVDAKPDLADLVDAVVRQDKPKMLEAARQYFNVEYRPQDLALATELIQQRPDESNGTADQVAEMMRRKLSELGINYKVEIDDRDGFQCRPDHADKVVRISRSIRLQYYPLEGIVRHELSHIIRAVNGEHNGISRQPGYLATDEGLACLVQDQFCHEPSPSLFQHALEYSASHLALEAGFRDVFNFLCDYGADPQTAWLRGIRQKFGLTDTSKPGSLMKSGMYFYHEQRLRELSEEELLRLYVGKIPESQLADNPEYTGLIPVKQLREFIFG